MPKITFIGAGSVTFTRELLRAALEGRRDHVLHAAMLDPATASALDLDATAALVDDLLRAHADRLPEGLWA